MTTTVPISRKTNLQRLGGAHHPTSSVEFTEAPAAPLETKRSAHTEPRQGRQSEPRANAAVGGTEAPETADAVNGRPLAVFSTLSADPDACLNERVDRACTQIMDAVNFLDANRGMGGVSLDTAIRCRERLQLALAGFRFAGLLVNPMRGI